MHYNPIQEQECESQTVPRIHKKEKEYGEDDHDSRMEI